MHEGTCVRALVYEGQGLNGFLVDDQYGLAYVLGIAVGALPMARGSGSHRTIINRQPWECLCHVDFGRLATKFKCEAKWDSVGVTLVPKLGRN
jgi:hypothetical protein